MAREVGATEARAAREARELSSASACVMDSPGNYLQPNLFELVKCPHSSMHC